MLANPPTTGDGWASQLSFSSGCSPTGVAARRRHAPAQRFIRAVLARLPTSDKYGQTLSVGRVRADCRYWADRHPHVTPR